MTTLLAPRGSFESRLDGIISRVPRSAYRWFHYGTLIAGFAVLLYLGSLQWFFFDEWDIIWQPEAARRFVEGHNGHWSAVPIAVWSLIQHLFGLSSYVPFLAIATLTHLTTAHLLWRILLRTGANGWISTFLTTVFIFFGAASENLLWAFQMGFVGAIAAAFGAILIAMRKHLGVRSGIFIATLLTVGAATSGTALPFFVTVAAILFFHHGVRVALLTLAAPTAIYLTWFFFLAGPNGTSVYRASGLGTTLSGIPAFIGQMFVGGYNASVPVPTFGIVVVVAIAGWTFAVIRKREWGTATTTSIGLALAGVVFAALTAYSRLGIGIDYADESRYIYVAVLSTLPVVALLLTRLAAREWRSRALILCLIGVVAVFNVGLLGANASGWSARELSSHADISAALAIADQYPDRVDWSGYPEPRYVPRTLEQLATLEEAFGLTRVSYSAADRLDALAQVGLSVVSAGSSCAVQRTELDPGDLVEVPAGGLQLVASEGASIVIAVVDDDLSGSERTIQMHMGVNELTAVEPLMISIRSTSGRIAICGD